MRSILHVGIYLVKPFSQQ